MELNSIIFPAPSSSYDTEDFPEELVWIPRYRNPQGPAIPCLILQCSRGSSKIILYFHGNAEDVCLTYELLDHIRNSLLVHVIAVEYPGYGVYAGKPSAAQLIEDADCVFSFLTMYLDIDPKDIIVFGRSIGSGPATWLASNHDPGGLLLMSAYTSLRAVVKHIAGRVAQYLIAERFKNIDLIAKVTCPTFLIHGQRDKLIPFSQSQSLHEKCSGPCNILLPESMDHNEFDYFDDLSLPVAGFLMQCGISVLPTNISKAFLKLPRGLFSPPPGQPTNQNKGRINKMFRRMA